MIRIILIAALLFGSASVLLANDPSTERVLNIVKLQRNQLSDLVAFLEARLQMAQDEIAALKKENEILKGTSRGP